MSRAPLRERTRYRFDNFMSRGTPALVAGLALVTATVVVVVALLIMLTGAAKGQEGPVGFLSLVWRNLMRSIDAGTVTGDSGSTLWLAAMLGVTIAGLFVLSALIGVISSGLDSKLEQLRKGRSRVLESGHTVVLGWSQEIFTVVSELIVANANQRRSCIVIMAPLDKVEMEEELSSRLSDRGRTRIVVRSGSPMDTDDVALANVSTAKSVIVLSPESDEPDTDVIKTLLAVINEPNRSKDKYHIVAEIHDKANVEVARMVGGDEVSIVEVDDLVARVTAQTCRQSGLSVVYSELLDFDGDEIYITAEPALTGKVFGDVLLAYEDSCVIGYVDGTGPHLNPPMDTMIGPGSQVIAISRDDDTVKFSSAPAAPDQTQICQPSLAPTLPERTLVLGWNDRAASIIKELDGYVSAGSVAEVVAFVSVAADEIAELTPRMSSMQLGFQQGDTTDRATLDALNIASFDHVIVLCYTQALDSQRADSRTLITLLHLRDIASRSGSDFSIVSEMLDIRNRDLAAVAQADDFIVSDRLVSLLVTQVSENRHLGPIFSDLLDEAGSEVYLRPISDYVVTGAPVSFATIVHAARQRGQIAIGYRIDADADSAANGFGVKVNPPKSSIKTFTNNDKVIVLAQG